MISDEKRNLIIESKTSSPEILMNKIRNVKISHTIESILKNDLFLLSKNINRKEMETIASSKGCYFD